MKKKPISELPTASRKEIDALDERKIINNIKQYGLSDEALELLKTITINAMETIYNKGTNQTIPKFNRFIEIIAKTIHYAEKDVINNDMDFNSAREYFNANYNEFIECKNFSCLEFQIKPTYIEYKLDNINKYLLNFSIYFVGGKNLEQQNKIVWMHEMFTHLQELIKRFNLGNVTGKLI